MNVAGRLPDRMRAAVFTGPRRVQIEEVPLPALGPGQALVRLEGCGLCGSNLPLWQGRPWFSYPTAPGEPGHEGWGTVVAMHSEPNWNVKIGDRVAGLTYRALAEYDVADVGSLVVLPSVLNDRPVPGEPLGCAMNVFRRCDISAGQKVAVVGIGFLGAVVTQLAVGVGASVFAISRRPFARAIAERMGAARVASCDPMELAVAEVMEWTGSAGCDRVIEAVGSQEALDLASRLVRTRGRLVIAGFHQDGARQVDLQDWNWRGLDVINAHERDPSVYVDGMRAAVDRLSTGNIDVGPLLTHAFSLDRVAQAFEALEARPDRFLKAQVLM